MKPSKFLLVCHSYPPVLGGSEIEAQRVCTALMARGHRMDVLCCGGPPMPDQARWVDPKGVPVRMFGGRSQGVWRDRTFAWHVFRTLVAERDSYEFVYFLMQGLHLAAGLLAARLAGKPVIMKVSGSGIIPAMAQSWIGRRELQWLRQWAHRVLILNSGMEAEALAQGFERRQLLWMPNPVDVQEFAPSTEREQLRGSLGLDEAPVALFVGRLSPEKNLPVLLDSFAKCGVAGARLVIVGDGPQRGELEAQAGRLGVTQRVQFAGRLPMDQVVRWMQAADVFVLLSRVEGFPCALVEAMSVGLASVVSAIPGNQQLVEDGRQGFVVPTGDVPVTARRLGELLNDRATARSMGAAARQLVVERYSSEQVAQRYEVLFDEVRGGERK